MSASKKHVIVAGRGVTAAEAKMFLPRDILGNMSDLNAAHSGFRGFLFMGYFFDLDAGSKKIVMYRW